MNCPWEEVYKEKGKLPFDAGFAVRHKDARLSKTCPRTADVRRGVPKHLMRLILVSRICWSESAV